MNFAKRAKEIESELIESRHFLHKNAELSLKEYKTTEYLVSELKKAGIEVISFDDYCGCIAVIKGAKPGKTVLLRADIDALPITEDSGVDFSSDTEGVMHACGHDCHTAMLLAAAKMLNESKDQLQGTVKCLFQSGEEVFIGSHYYWDKGYLDDVDAAMGLHVWNSIPAGTMAIKDGYLMASCDNFHLTIKGKSAHGSTPNLGNDAITAASAAIINIQSIVSRMADPLDTLVVTIGKITAGKEFNIICDNVTMEGTIRAYAPKGRELAIKKVGEIARQTAEVYGCTAEISFDEPELSVCNSDIKLNDLARQSAVKLYGENVLTETRSATGSEDFSYIMDKIPSSLFIFLGYYDEEQGCVYPAHNEKFKINESILHIGAAQYAQFAADYLDANAGGEQ